MTSNFAPALYVHVPFCARKCTYCDFLSVGAPLESNIHRYLEFVRQELSLWRERLASPRIRSVFIGGGTPTYLDAGRLEVLLSAVGEHFTLEGVEFTLEANPGTLDRTKLKVCRRYGVNRLSMGVQSFSDEVLARIGRIHNARQAAETVVLARQEGFTNLSIDLMFALPGQSRKSWEETLARAVELEPDHISVYSLILEEGTPLWVRVTSGLETLPGEEEELEMYQLAQAVLRNAGYEQYEISNFARPGFRSAHNQVYWRNEPYVGVGPGAHSFIDGRRLENEAELVRYCLALAEGQLPVASTLVVSRDAMMDETMMMGMRLLEGVSFQRFQDRFDVDLRDVYATELAYLSAKGLIVIDSTGVRLSQMGIPLANLVFREFLR